MSRQPMPFGELMTGIESFCASAVSSLLCAVSASNCLRACAVDNSTASDSDFTVMNSVAKSNAALVLARAASIILSP